MIGKILNFAAEKYRWYKAGRPFRTDARIAELFDICNQCKYYNKSDEEHGNCSICGCRLTKFKATLSKNSWATTKCPLDEPKWVEESDQTELMQKLDAVAQERDNPPPPPEPPKGGCGCR